MPTKVAPLVMHEEISQLSLFQRMAPQFLQKITSAARAVQYKKGKVFLGQGQAITKFYIVLDGWCGASKENAAGQESISQIFGCGDFLLEPGQSEGSLVNLKALTTVRLLILPLNIINDASQCPAFITNMLAASLRRCQELRAHIEQLTLSNSEERVGRFVLRMRINYGVGGKEMMLPFGKSFIAAHLGIKPETLSRVLRQFKNGGFAIERNRLTAPHQYSLCRYCDADIMSSCPFSHSDECTQRT